MARRFRRWPSAWALITAAMLVAAVSRPWWPGQAAQTETALVSSQAGSEVALASGRAEILRALDGNTVLISQDNNRRYRVRLLGVIDCTDPRAIGALSQIAAPGPARIELDERRAAADGSWLAYVYVNERLVNASIVRSGWGRYEPYPGDSFSHGRLMKEGELAARREKLGIWTAQ